MLVGFAPEQQNHFADDFVHVDRFSLWRSLLVQRSQTIVRADTGEKSLRDPRLLSPIDIAVLP
jgi:hypothetical protein